MNKRKCYYKTKFDSLFRKNKEKKNAEHKKNKTWEIERGKNTRWENKALKKHGAGKTRRQEK